MQAEMKFTFDLGSPAGRAEFQRLFGHMLSPAAPERVDLSDLPAGQPGEITDAELKELRAAGPIEEAEPASTPRRMPPPNLTSIPDDPVRAAAARAGRQEAAAKARAAKAAKAAGSPVDRSSDGPNNMPLDVEPDLGPEPNGQDHAAEDMGLDDPNMSPAEAKEAGLVLMRELFGAGKVAEMKAIQKKWGVAKFYDIPVEQGHEFYRQGMQAMHETGLRK